MAGGAQAKMSTWFSKPNQSLISKVTKKRVGFNLKIFVFALLKTVHCRAERNPGRIGRLFNCNDYEPEQCDVTKHDELCDGFGDDEDEDDDQKICSGHQNERSALGLC